MTNQDNPHQPSLDNIEKEEALRMERLHDEGATLKSRFSVVNAFFGNMGSFIDSLLWKLCESDVEEDKEYEKKRAQKSKNK